MRRYLIVSLVMIPGMLLAGDSIKINAKKLPKGMTAAKARSIVSKDAAVAKAKARAQSQAIERRSRAAWQKLAPIRTAMAKQEKSNTEYRSFMKGARNLMTSKNKTRVAKLRKHYKDGKDLLERTYKKAGADEEDVKKLLANIYDINYSYLALIGVRLQKLLEASQEPALPATFSFGPPYAFQSTSDTANGPGIESSDVRIDDNTGRMTLDASATSVGAYSTGYGIAYEGFFIDVPADARRMTVTLHFTFNWSTSCWAAGGYGTARAEATLVASSQGVVDLFPIQENIFTEEISAIFAGGDDGSDSDSSTMTRTINVTAGERFKIFALANNFAQGAYFGGGAASIDFTATQFDITFEE